MKSSCWATIHFSGNTSTSSRSLILVGWEKQWLERNWDLHQSHSNGVLLCSVVLSSWSNELSRSFKYGKSPHLSRCNHTISASTQVCLSPGWRLSNLPQKVLQQVNYQHKNSWRSKVISIFFSDVPPKIPIVYIHAPTHHFTPQPYKSQTTWPNTTWWTCVSSKVRAVWPWAKEPTNILPAGN